MSILPVAIQHPLMMLLVATLHAFGSAAYYGSFHSGLFRAIGQAEKPGKAAAMFDVSKTLGFIVASCVVFTLTGMNLTWCMPFVASLFLFFAALELLKLDLGDSLSNQTPWPGWRQYFNAVTPQCLLANFNVDQPFIKNGIPLVAVIVSPPLAFLSAAGVTTGTIISTLVGGKAFDTRNSSLLIKSALIIGACAVSYSFLSPTYFALATAVSIIAMAPISIARDARTAEETASSNNILAAMAFESARSLGGLVGNGILLALYVVTNNIPTWLPLVGFIVFIYGKLRYVLHKTGGTAF
jgi:hypothetical protein